MNGYAIHPIDALITGNPYVGRGLVLGVTENERCACAAYFIMGRSENSRNRVFCETENGDVRTVPFDESKVEDPSLIIYNAVRSYQNNLIVTNGDQTDTVYDGLVSGKSFSAALESRCFEPDAPNYTPRISGLLTFTDGACSYRLSILKSLDAAGSACTRQTFAYPGTAGLGHFLHTYVTDGNPLPSFEGEPERVFIPDDIDAFTNALWTSLDADNKISLYVRYTDLATGAVDKRLINKHAEGTHERV